MKSEEFSGIKQVFNVRGVLQEPKMATAKISSIHARVADDTNGDDAGAISIAADLRRAAVTKPISQPLETTQGIWHVKRYFILRLHQSQVESINAGGGGKPAERVSAFFREAVPLF